MTLVPPESQPSLATTTEEIIETPAESRPGDSFVQTAVDCMEVFEWKKAVVALNAAKTLRPSDPSIDLLLLEAASNANRRRLARSTRSGLGHRLDRLPDGLIASAAANLADRKYPAADKAARAALQLDPGNARAWTLLAASYAGLGWFDQSRECLEGAARHGTSSPIDLWYVGRATNDWAMDRSRVLLTTLVASFLAGVLFALSLAIATPFFIREFRVRRLPAEFRVFADHHWESDAKPRIIAGAVSLTFLAFYVASLLLMAPAS